MKPLLNALAFATVVIAAFAMDSNLPQRIASSPLVAQAVSRVRCERPARVMSPDALPQIEQAKLERAMERMQVAQGRLARVDRKRMEVRIQGAQHAASLTNCKVIKIDQ